MVASPIVWDSCGWACHVRLPFNPKIVPQPGMDDDPQAVAGCITVIALVVVAPFIIAAIPVLLGASLGIVAFWLAGLLIAAVVGAIFK